MKQHRGEIVRMRIEKSGLNLSDVYARYPKPKNTFLTWLDQPNLSWDKIWRIGQIIGWDFREDFPELRKMKFIPAEGIFEFSEPYEDYNVADFRELVMKRFGDIEKAQYKSEKTLEILSNTLRSYIKANS